MSEPVVLPGFERSDGPQSTAMSAVSLLRVPIDVRWHDFCGLAQGTHLRTREPAGMTLTAEAVLALAPDESSAKAARGLASPSNWPSLGANHAAVWGECLGSGSKPYQTQVDLSGPAFKCSCPSRKFPCKHGLALLLVRAQEAQRFTTAAAPGWVSEWLSSRSEKAQKKEERQIEKTDAPADPQAAAKRAAQRWQRVDGAGHELQRWLADQIARGLGAVNTEMLKTWHTMAARMVDAQAPGLGVRVRIAADGVNRGDNWPARTLERLGVLQLICEALQRRTDLPDDVQADLRSAIGWPHDKGEVLAYGQHVPDRWTVLGCVQEERDDKLIERRVWLHGERSGRRAWLLEHSFGGRGFETAWLTGSCTEATLVFFPGASKLRALASEVVGRHDVAVWPQLNLHEEWDIVAQRVAACPWAGLHPVVMRNASPVPRGDDLYAVAEGRALPLALGVVDRWKLHAVAGGLPIHLMGEWDGERLKPLTAWRDESAAPAWTRSAL